MHRLVSPVSEISNLKKGNDTDSNLFDHCSERERSFKSLQSRNNSSLAFSEGRMVTLSSMSTFLAYSRKGRISEHFIYDSTTDKNNVSKQINIGVSQ